MLFQTVSENGGSDNQLRTHAEDTGFFVKQENMNWRFLAATNTLYMRALAKASLFITRVGGYCQNNSTILHFVTLKTCNYPFPK